MLLLNKKNIKRYVLDKSNYIKVKNKDNNLFSDYDFIKCMESEKDAFIKKKKYYFIYNVLNKFKIVNVIELNKMVEKEFENEIIRNINKNKQIKEFNRIYFNFNNLKELNVNDVIYSVKNNNLLFYLYDKEYYNKTTMTKIKNWLKDKEIKTKDAIKAENLLSTIIKERGQNDE